MSNDSDAHESDAQNPDEELLVPQPDRLLEIYQAGKLTVVGFGEKQIPGDHNVALYRDEIVELLRQHECEAFAFDMTGVPIVPSGILGLIASIRNLGVKVSVYNPSPDLRAVFEATQIDRVVELRDIDTA